VHGLTFVMKNGTPDSLLEQTRKMMRRFHLRARKGLGQHFLVDGEALEAVVAAADLQPTDTVIEVGPGLGILTAELARNAGWVIAIELDDTLASILTRTLPTDNVVVLNQDVLGTDPAELFITGSPHVPAEMASYKVVANLPYYITSPVLRHFLEAAVKPAVMVVMVQKEVAETIAAGPGKRSLLSIAVQLYGEPELVRIVPRESFFPAPEVDSAIVRIRVYPGPKVAVDEDAFFKVVRAGFTAARKQLGNSLAQGLKMTKEEATELLEAAGVDPRRRAETLELEEWAAVLRAATRTEKE
jgi:16S rRNA (adenine1518-N6/adenine1519-N6)-dimethyltransferase